MKYVMIALLLLVSMYQLSYAKYNWAKKNKLGAAGAALLAILVIIYPVIVMFMR